MNFDSRSFGAEGLTTEDVKYEGSSFAEVRSAIFANAYYRRWGSVHEPPLPVYEVTLRRTLVGLLRKGKRWLFQQASDRAVDSRADLRWGIDRRGFRRLLHPNGVCLVGEWQIDVTAGTPRPYTGYFAKSKRALVIARYSVCCTETRRGRYRSLSMVGKLYPTDDMKDRRPYRPAHFITQEDFGGSKSFDISQVELRNAPDTTPWRRGWGVFVLLLTGLVLRRTDRQPTIRQLYEIAELGEPANGETSAPEFMRLIAEPPTRAIDGPDVDFRDEILGRIYDKGDTRSPRELTFRIDVSDTGYTKGLLLQRRVISNWKTIGKIVFREAVASYNGDFVLHFHHPAWRDDRNDPKSVVRRVRR